KLPLSYKKFEGDIEELSKEIAEKLNTKGKVFELEILQGNGNEEDEEFYVKFTQYKNLPTYNDIGGYHFAKRIVKAWDPEKSERKSLSFVGEPGTGKTTLALAKLNEYANKTSGTGIVINRIPGYISLETLKDLLYALFSEKNKKLMLLLDDAEELVRVEKRRDTLKLLEELKASYVPVIMTFNDKNILRDEAIYGRLGIPVYFDFPNKEEREEILEILAKKYGIELSPSIKSKLAAHTENFSGRFLEMIFVYAKEMKNSQKNIEELLEEGVKYVKENIINPLRKYQGIYPFSSEEEKRYYYY
ncbi:MAG TPA: ATP-binding protein, partial [Nanoarchaeota archaeon]|nr:ATP-binding protein [Nanoarchaeota archaeon]